MHSNLEVFGSLFFPVVPLFDLGSCSKYAACQKACNWLHRVLGFESYKVVEQVLVTLTEVARMNVTCTSYKWTMTVMDSISEFEIVMWSISDHERVTLRSSLCMA